jgi:hypothetical protein
LEAMDWFNKLMRMFSRGGLISLLGCFLGVLGKKINNLVFFGHTSGQILGFSNYMFFFPLNFKKIKGLVNEGLALQICTLSFFLFGQVLGPTTFDLIFFFNFLY